MFFFLEIPIRLLDAEKDKVFSSVFPDAFLLSLPNCSVYANMNATLLYSDVSTNENSMPHFHPQCG